jgi:flagellar motor switch protein FliN/FliY
MSDAIRESLASEFANDLARAIEAMTGEQPGLKLTGAASLPLAEWALWGQKFNTSDGTAWLAAAPATWISLGSRTLRAAGIEDDDPATARSTFTEVLGQAFSMLARAMSGRTGREWSCTEGREYNEQAPAAALWSSIDLVFPDGSSERLLVSFDDAVLAAISGGAPRSQASPPPNTAVRQVISAPQAPKSKTLDLLLDVELPVSVSFGRAQLPLKDVIKLTTGSIVELNRTLAEPVEVIVNNCVIARGEVVVIEGNFGVRIQQVVSREERLRTLF